VRPVDRSRLSANGLSEADIEAVERYLTMLQKNDMVPTKYHVLRRENDRRQGGQAAADGWASDWPVTGQR
jgi:hypothetical protein